MARIQETPEDTDADMHIFIIKSRMTVDDGETLQRYARSKDMPLAVLTRIQLKAFAEQIRAKEREREVPGRPSNVLLFKKQAA